MLKHWFRLLKSTTYRRESPNAKPSPDLVGLVVTNIQQVADQRFTEEENSNHSIFPLLQGMIQRIELRIDIYHTKVSFIVT